MEMIAMRRDNVTMDGADQRRSDVVNASLGQFTEKPLQWESKETDNEGKLHKAAHRVRSSKHSGGALREERDNMNGSRVLW